MPPISSTYNKQIKAIRGLQHRRERDRTGRYFVDGIHLVNEAIRHGAEIERLVVAPELLARHAGPPDLPHALPCLEVTGRVYETLAHRAALAYGAQGVGAVIRQSWDELPDDGWHDDLCWVGLAAPHNPGNLGTVLRTCDAVGAAGVILIGPSTDPHDPAAIRASMGAIFSQRLVRTDLQELERWKRRSGVRIVGTACDAAQDYRAYRYNAPTVLLMGNEHSGLTADQTALCDALVRIPMVGACNSLNLGVATGVVLYEMFAQRNGGWGVRITPPGARRAAGSCRPGR
jgi:TrmH family RNA methyltransferase